MSEKNDAADPTPQRAAELATQAQDQSEQDQSGQDQSEQEDRERLRDRAAAATERAREAVKETVTTTIANTKEVAADAFDKVIDSIESLGKKDR